MEIYIRVINMETYKPVLEELYSMEIVNEDKETAVMSSF